MRVLGIDPGLSGALVLTDGKQEIQVWAMPVMTHGKMKEIDFEKFRALLVGIKRACPSVHVFLERAIPFAMGSKSAFNYGRGFEALVIALRLVGLPTTQVEPARWTKEMHEGVSSELKPKIRSLVATQRLFPQLVKELPKKTKGDALHDGPIDALLIAGYGLRRIGAMDEVGDFL